MNKKVMFSFQLNPNEAKFIDEACLTENRTRSSFILVACLKRAEKIFDISNKEIPDLSDEEELPQEEEVEENISYGKDDEEGEE